MKISDEALGCLGAVFLLILAVLSNGIIAWGIGNLIIWTFKIDLVFHLWQGLIVGLIWSFLRASSVKGARK